MTHRSHKTSFGVLAAGVAIMAMATLASAVEVDGLVGFEDLFGRYAPGGNCGKQPQILVDSGGITLEVIGVVEKVSNPEFAASYGGPAYNGISKWFFPVRIASGYAVLMTFNANEQKGVLLIEGHDEGWAGGPPLSPYNKALVQGSPYARCK